MKKLLLLISLLFAIGCTSELDRCMEANTKSVGDLYYSRIQLSNIFDGWATNPPGDLDFQYCIKRNNLALEYHTYERGLREHFFSICGDSDTSDIMAMDFSDRSNYVKACINDNEDEWDAYNNAAKRLNQKEKYSALNKVWEDCNKQSLEKKELDAKRVCNLQGIY